MEDAGFAEEAAKEDMLHVRAGTYTTPVGVGIRSSRLQMCASRGNTGKVLKTRQIATKKSNFKKYQIENSKQTSNLVPDSRVVWQGEDGDGEKTSHKVRIWGKNYEQHRIVLQRWAAEDGQEHVRAASS